MFLVEQITADAVQKQTLVLQDGSQVIIQMRFVPMQVGWFFDSITYGSFIVNGLRITNSPNMLYQFKNQIPFGIACFSTNNREPSQQQDFSSGASVLYVLSQDEIVQYSELLSGKISA